MQPTQGYAPTPTNLLAGGGTVEVGRYRLLKPLGAGGMGTVYEAFDPQLNRVVALKVPRFEGPPEAQAERALRFQREAQAAAGVRHPHVCPIYDVGVWRGLPYVVMAHIEGESLARRLSDKSRAFGQEQAIILVRQVLDALEAIHAHRIIHRDLKPANILLDADGRSLVTDFGLARSAENQEPLTADGAVMGTPGYMAPEQALGQQQQIGPWTDVYSVGVILYQLVTGRLPFEGPAVAVLVQSARDRPPAPSSLQPDLDPQLEGVILKAMAREPPDRYPTAREFNQALARCSALPASSQPTIRYEVASEVTRADRPAQVPTRRRRWAAVALLAAVAALLALAALLYGPGLFTRSGAAKSSETPPKETMSVYAPQKPKEDPAAERLRQVSADALAKVQRHGQAIARRAYPLAPGGVTYSHAERVSTTRIVDAYEATVRLYYSNALGLTYYLEIVAAYDALGNFRSWKVSRYNDPFPPAILGKSFDRWPE